MALKSSHEILLQAGEAHSTICVSNLLIGAVTVGTDAWGRSGKAQHILVSAAVSLRESFVSAAEGDTVDGSTIHYGVLSKGIVGAVGTFEKEGGGSLVGLWEWVERWLLNGGGERGEGRGVLDGRKIEALELEIRLPKASLLGSGVSVVGTRLFMEDGELGRYSRGLRIHELRVPTLVGVNPNERLAKQIVVATITIDCWAEKVDNYANLEQLVVKTIEESSFETLEALALHLGRYITRYFLSPHWLSNPPTTETERIKIRLEKPTAVTFADAPAVETLFDPQAQTDNRMARICSNLETAKAPPFPLQGRLDEWIRSTYSGGDETMVH